MSGNLRERVARELARERGQIGPNGNPHISCYDDADAVLGLLAQEWRERRSELIGEAWRAKYPATRALIPETVSASGYEAMLDAIGAAFFGAALERTDA